MRVAPGRRWGLVPPCSTVPIFRVHLCLRVCMCVCHMTYMVRVSTLHSQPFPGWVSGFRFLKVLCCRICFEGIVKLQEAGQWVDYFVS